MVTIFSFDKSYSMVTPSMSTESPVIEFLLQEG